MFAHGMRLHARVPNEDPACSLPTALLWDPSKKINVRCSNCSFVHVTSHADHRALPE